MFLLPLLPVGAAAFTPPSDTGAVMGLRVRCTGFRQSGWPRPQLLVHGCFPRRWRQRSSLFLLWRISLSGIQIDESAPCGKNINTSSTRSKFWVGIFLLSGGDLFALPMAFYFTVPNESAFNLLQREHVVKSDGGKLYLISPFLIFELTKHVRVNDARSDHKNFL